VANNVTFSGFNQIDFGYILNAVMAQERQPLAALETRKTTLQTQNTAFGTLAGKLTSLGAAADKLKDLGSMSVLSASSSDEGVGASATGGTVRGTYGVVVSELARAQVTASSSTFTATTDVVGTGGSITLTPTSGAPVTISLTGSTTLAELADLINDDEDSAATASVVQVATGSYKLVLTARETGLSNAFTLTSALTGGSGVAFTDTDNDGVSGDSALDNAQSALDAAFTVNGLPVTSASNTVENVVPGVTLTLAKKDPATNVVVSVSRDVDKAKELVTSFITAYNNIVTFMKEQSTAAISGKASIGRDPLLRGFKDNLRDAMLREYTGGTFTSLPAVGIGFDRDGKMTLDSDAFEEVMSSSVTDVQRLFSGADGESGAFGRLSGVIDDYTESGGLVAIIRERLDAQVTGLNTRISNMEAMLELRRSALQQEYIAADLLMTRLKSQSSSLQSIGSNISF
jgi:flagellar hook-associated protein 2